LTRLPFSCSRRLIGRDPGDARAATRSMAAHTATSA
jgi:hypothetical protein